MFVINVSCSVCKEAFRNSDDIYSTSCGHVYHFFCMNQWRSKSSSCPQCRSYNPTTHKIYLNTDDAHGYKTIVKDLQAKITNADNQIKKTKEEVDKKEQKANDIKRLYNISEQWRAELEYKIQTLQGKIANYDKDLDGKEKEIQSLKTFVDTVEKSNGVQELYEENKKAKEEVESITSRLSFENLKLKEHLSESEALNLILNHKIEILDQRLKHFKFELEKQISENVNRSIDKMEQPSQCAQKKQYNAKNRKQSEEPTKKQQRFLFALPTSKMLPIQRVRRQYELQQPNDCIVIIKDLPSAMIYMNSVECAVIKLASIMSITLTIDAIKTATKFMEHKASYGKTILLVEFKTIEVKIDFLSRKHYLKLNPTTRDIKIKEYINEHIYPIFMYASKNLRENGYEYIYCKDNKVFAKRKREDKDETQIQTKCDVDRLIGKSILLG